jgi:hypothetical protein
MGSKGHRKCCIAEWDGDGSRVLGGGGGVLADWSVGFLSVRVVEREICR